MTALCPKCQKFRPNNSSSDRAAITLCYDCRAAAPTTLAIDPTPRVDEFQITAIVEEYLRQRVRRRYKRGCSLESARRPVTANRILREIGQLQTFSAGRLRNVNLRDVREALDVLVVNDVVDRHVSRTRTMFNHTIIV